MTYRFKFILKRKVRALQRHSAR